MLFNRSSLSNALRIAFGGGVASIAALAVPSWAQTGESPSIQTGERVEVTGSSIKRIDAETALPVTILNRADIDRLSPQNVEDLLRSVTSTNATNAVQISSGSFATTGGEAEVSLRGLGAQRTLVLVNGRRVAPFGGAAGVPSIDINSIPLAAIERVEILRDGASAIYGSDAIAGVINFILRSDFTGALIEGVYGQTTHSGDGKSYNSDVVLGYGDLERDRFNVMLTASWDREAAIYGNQRYFANSVVSTSGPHDTTSGNTYPANIVIASGAARNFLSPFYAAQVANGTYPTFGFTNCAPSIPRSSILLGSTTAIAKDCRYDPGSEVALMPDALRTAVGIQARFAITPNVEAYGEANAQHNVSKYRLQAGPLSDQLTLNAADPYIPKLNALINANLPALTAAYGAAFVGTQAAQTGLYGHDSFLLPTTSPYYPAAFAAANGLAGSPIDLRYRTNESGERTIRDANDSDRFVAGVKGTFFDFDFDAGVLYTQARTRESLLDGYPLYSKILPLLNSGVVNPFGPSTPAAQQQIKAANFYGQAYESNTSLLSLNGRISRDVYTLPAGPLGVALGGEVRREQYFLNASTQIQSGDLSGYGGNFLNQGDYRNVEAGFFEVNVPIVKGLEINGSGRYDNYEYVGNTFNPKVSLRWQPIKEFLLRAAWGHGFRAPSLTDVAAPAVQSVSQIESDPLRCPITNSSTDCVTQFTQVSGGNRSLKPETSISRNFGFILEPTASVHFGADYFGTIVRNTIGAITPDQIFNNLNKYGSLITRGAPDPANPTLPGPIILINQQLQNTNNLHASGFDMDLKLRFDAPVGRVTAAINGTYITRYDIQADDGSYQGVIANAGNAGSVVPRWKHVASIGYDYGPYSATIVENYQSSYIDYDGVRRVGSSEIYDVLGSYSGIKGLTLTLGIKNIFDRDPPYSVGSTSQFQGGYDASVQSPRGRFLYGKFSYLFR